ncbi:MAG: hypothetical protein KTR31_07590 [Myxococcales bacterium]|nr:hypothetical protein [Myxococcales bacterium]
MSAEPNLGAPPRHAGMWSRFVDRVSSVEGATSFALFRIGMGLSVIYDIGSTVLAGLVPVLWIDVSHGGMRALGDGPWLVEWLGGPMPNVVWPLVFGALFGGLMLTLGIGGRAMALVTLVVTNNLLDINGHAGGSYDELLSNGLWLCVLGGGQGTLSVTARLQHGTWWPAATSLAFPRWLAAYQLVLMYCMTGLQKLSAAWVPWGDSSALYFILQQPSWHRSDMSWLAYVFPLTQLATMVTWFWEVLAPTWLLAVWWAGRTDVGRIGQWANRIGYRWIYMGIGLFMHLAIFLTMEVGPFSFISVCFYAAMVHPAEWHSLVRWIRERSPRLRPE